MSELEKPRSGVASSRFPSGLDQTGTEARQLRGGVAAPLRMGRGPRLPGDRPRQDAQVSHRHRRAWRSPLSPAERLELAGRPEWGPGAPGRWSFVRRCGRDGQRRLFLRRADRPPRTWAGAKWWRRASGRGRKCGDPPPQAQNAVPSALPQERINSHKHTVSSQGGQRKQKLIGNMPRETKFASLVVQMSLIGDQKARPSLEVRAARSAARQRRAGWGPERVTGS